MVHVGVDLRHIEAGGRVKAVHAQIEQRGGAQQMFIRDRFYELGLPPPNEKED